VALNDRKLGLFVLKEGFSKEFLRLHFVSPHGNLYDGGLHHEIDEPLELDFGDGPADRSDLQRLNTAARISDPAARWTELQTVLDMDRFISFMAMEILLNHIDGYCLMQNNYRLYFQPGGRQAVFLPHGTDRMFGDPTAALEPPMRALVANAVITTPQGHARYEKRLQELIGTAFDPSGITNRIAQAVRLLAPVEPLVEREAQPVRDRILKRIEWARGHTMAPGSRTP
jgi:spore coat protein H